jgi:predicted esterase
MRTRVLCPVCVAALVLTGLPSVLLAAPKNPKVLIIFKDGFTLRGEIKQEYTVIDDPSGQVVRAPKPGNLIILDDEARRMIFSHKQVLDPSPEPPGQTSKEIRLQSLITRYDRFKLQPGHYGKITPFNQKWDRELTLDLSAGGYMRIAQHLSILTPHFLRIAARRYEWNAHYLTGEWDPDLIRQLLYWNPELKLTGGPKDVAKRFKVFHFMVQAGWYDRALNELDLLVKEFPDERSRVDQARDDVKKILAAQLVDFMEEGNKTGRHEWVQRSLASVPRKDMDEGLQARLRSLDATYETANKNVALVRRFLEELPPRIGDSELRELFTTASTALLAELGIDTVGRLEVFQKMAELAERNKQGAQSPEQLMALAVSGWLLGNNLAETKVDSAARLWRARQFVFGYVRNHDPVARERLGADFQKRSNVAPDELAQVIRTLPPAEPYEGTAAPRELALLGTLPLPQAALSWALTVIQNALLPTSLQFEVNLPWTYRKGTKYRVQLPPEYHRGRDYPVLFALHDGGESPDIMLQRWGRLAAQHGYLLVAPQWEHGLNHVYSYTEEEQAAVVNVLRDLCRQFDIDTDRVFVTGKGEGGTMAYDVGLSHPDLFAGILPMGGRPRYFARVYRNNAQNLPFYVVDGDLDGDASKENRAQFEYWVPRGYPVLWIEYKGRGIEWFDGELPYMFDWMGRKKRATAFPLLGKSGGGLFGEEYQCLRPTDNRFYWLSGEDLSDRHNNDRYRWKASMMPATLQAQMGAGNQLNITASGFRKVAVWLGPGMIDFDKPVKIQVNLQLRWANRKITPSIETLLEDFYRRGDPRRLTVAKVEVPL